MADFFQNLDPASQPPTTPYVLGFDRNSYQHPVSHINPDDMDDALQKAANTSLSVALPLGLAAIGGPEAMTLKTLIPAAMASIMGRMDHPKSVTVGGKSYPVTEAAVPDPEQAGVTAAQVLSEAANKKGLPYAQWQAQNPGAENGMFDYQNAQPAMEGRAPVERYDPPRGVSDRMKDALADPQVGQALRAAVQKGVQSLPDSWYRTGPLYDVFKQELGDAAPQAYERFMQMVASTSPRARVPDNVRTASYYYHLDQTGQPIPDKPAPGYGSLAQKLHRQNVINVQNGGMNPLQNPKPTSFVENLLGNETPVTIDTHNFRMLGQASKDPRFLATSVEGSDFNPRKAFAEGNLTMDEALKHPTYWESAPNKNEYGAYEAYQQQQAKKMGMTPAEWQEKMWVGGGEETGLGSDTETFLRTVAKRVQYTAIRLGVDPQVVLQKFVKGEIPLLGIGAGMATVGLHPSGTGQPSTQRGQ
jgi:hypothetical protein